MRVISSSELRSNMKKYLDLAKSEKIFIQRGKTEVFELVSAGYMEPDEDLKRAITMDELLENVKEDLKELFNVSSMKRT